MNAEIQETQLFYEYFSEWIEIYKRGAVRPVTYQKYLMTLKRLTELSPSLMIQGLDKRKYQSLLNEYAKTHERQTTLDFHHHLKSAILDAVDEGLLSSDPTRKVVIKGQAAGKKKAKYLCQSELQSLLKNLSLTDEPNWDWLVLLIAKTGLRFSEALALTPSDFDFPARKISVTKTWNYKNADGGFADTKNESSVRTIPIDTPLSESLENLIKDIPADRLIFVRGRVFNSTINS